MLKVLTWKGVLKMIKYPDSYFIGKKFGRLTVQYVYKEKDSTGNTRRYCHCKCECGNEKNVKTIHIVGGYVQSCGCLFKDTITEFNKTTKVKHNLSHHSLYRLWGEILHRCRVTTGETGKNYGGRGIRVCEEWKNHPEIFIKWCLENGWKKGLTIDRIDVNGNYEPNNCRFTDYYIQNTNKRIAKNNTSGYVGVYEDKKRKRWHSSIMIKGTRHRLGYFTSKKDALDARNNYIIKNNLTEYKLQKWKGN